MLREHSAKVIDVIAGAFTTLALKLHENLGVRRANCAGVAVAEIDAAVWQANVVQDGDNFVPGNHLANRLIHLVGQARRFLDTKTSASAHVEANLAGVNAREEITTQD